MKLRSVKNHENGIMYTTPAPMESWVTEVHRTKSVYQCANCEYKCTSEAAIREHYRKTHPKVEPVISKTTRTRLFKRTVRETEDVHS